MRYKMTNAMTCETIDCDNNNDDDNVDNVDNKKLCTTGTIMVMITLPDLRFLCVETTRSCSVLISFILF
jgi:hypothetical protein